MKKKRNKNHYVASRAKKERNLLKMYIGKLISGKNSKRLIPLAAMFLQLFEISKMFYRVRLYETLHAFITGSVGYCNSVLIGIQDAFVQTVQLLQNSAAHLLSKTDRYAYITPVLKALQWLPLGSMMH